MNSEYSVPFAEEVLYKSAKKSPFNFSEKLLPALWLSWHLDLGELISFCSQRYFGLLPSLNAFFIAWRLYKSRADGRAIGSKSLFNFASADGILSGFSSYLHQEADRNLLRHRKRLWRDLVRCKNRVKGFLAYCGLAIPPQFDNPHWSHNFITWLQQAKL